MKPTLIPERLIKARESLKLNKSQAAELLGLSPIGYLRYEQGLRTPSPQMLNIIALTFNTSVDFLTGKTKNSAANQILLNKDDNSYLFELAQSLSTKEIEQSKRLLAYYKKLCQEQ